MEIQKRTLNKQNIIVVQFGNEINPETQSLTGTIELDIENQIQFIEHMNAILDDEPCKLILKMDNISYIDSSGLWALFETHKKAEQRQGKVALLNPKKDVKRVLDITKMSSKIAVFNTQKEAVAYLSE